MVIFEAVPPVDWAAFFIGLAGLIFGYIQSRSRLPKWVRRWMDRLGQDKVEQAVEYAARLSELSPEERRREAAAYLIRLSEKELGFPIPESIANLLVEFVYQQWKRRV
ncbi:MAG: hypothetical protein HYX78_09870 [Armatimonadetes bacterium]|nr:hypothetical protein [Armatimonadota bacterium]